MTPSQPLDLADGAGSELRFWRCGRLTDHAGYDDAGATCGRGADRNFLGDSSTRAQLPDLTRRHLEA